MLNEVEIVTKPVFTDTPRSESAGRGGSDGYDLADGYSRKLGGAHS